MLVAAAAAPLPGGRHGGRLLQLRVSALARPGTGRLESTTRRACRYRAMSVAERQELVSWAPMSSRNGESAIIYRMRRIASVIVILVSSCSRQQNFPSRPAAPHSLGPNIEQKSVINIVMQSTEFRALRLGDATVSLPYTTAEMTQSQLNAAKMLRQEGWLELGSNGRVAMSSKAHRDSRFYERTDHIDITHIANKQLTRIVSFETPQSGVRSIAFEWHWSPNDLGSILPSALRPEEAMIHKATAIVQWDGFHEWSLAQLRAE